MNSQNTDGRCTREVGKALRRIERVQREAERDIQRAANLRKASNLPGPKFGPKVAR